eukprot:Lithocolla_globosa_v1_NODE_15_length_10543_cov_26.361651.p7 type:complete len:148 gc:universal NODE_15_length_10543_cov_26.361651:7932-7489(-)
MVGNTWIIHVKAYQSSHPGMSYREAMKSAKSTYKPVRGGCKMVGHGLDTLVEAGLDASSNTDELLQLADKGLSFTKGVLEDDTRIRRVEKRQDRRDTRAKDRQARRSKVKTAKSDKKVAKISRKTKAIERKQEIKDAKHERKLNRIN